MDVFCCFAHLPGETQLQPAQPKGILPRPDGKTSAQGAERAAGSVKATLRPPLSHQSSPAIAYARPCRCPIPTPPHVLVAFLGDVASGLPASSTSQNCGHCLPKKREPEFGNVERSPPCSFFYAFTTGNPPFVTFLMVEMTYWTTSETKAIQLRQNMAAKPSASRIFGEHWPITRFSESKTRRQQHFNSNVAAAIPLALTLFLVLML